MDFKIQSALEASGYGEDQMATPVPPVGAGGSPDPNAPGDAPGNADVRMVGRYRIVGHLGRGGMGEVVRAVNSETGQLLAIKLLDSAGYEDEEMVRRFEREAEAVREIEHPNIARFYGLERDEQGFPFIVMEFIEGEPLDRYLKNHPDLPLSRAIYFIAQTARGLEFARRRAVIHRDIKPANLIIQSEDKLKIIDFGLAKSLWDRSMLTGTGTVLGTPRYMSPEQALGRNVDHQADLYALGVTFYELATGQVPFDGDSAAAIMMKHVNAPVVPPSKVNPRISMDVNDIIVRMLAKDLADRYPDYEALIRDLEMARIQQMSREKREAAAAADSTIVFEAPGHEAIADGGQYRAEGGGSDGVPGEPGQPGRRNRPSPYLTDGLVQVQYTDDEEPPPRSRLLLYTFTGLVILAACAYFLLRGTGDEGAPKETSSLTKLVSRFANSGRSVGPTPLEMAVEDQENVRQTRERLEAVRVKILRFAEENLPPGEQPLIRQMRMSDAISTEESQDAWGNDFYTTRGDGASFYLFAAGRDRVEGTKDDFSMALDGSRSNIPPAMTEENFLKQR